MRAYILTKEEWYSLFVKGETDACEENGMVDIISKRGLMTPREARCLAYRLMEAADRADHGCDCP